MNNNQINLSIPSVLKQKKSRIPNPKLRDKLETDARTQNKQVNINIGINMLRSVVRKQWRDKNSVG